MSAPRVLSKLSSTALSTSTLRIAPAVPSAATRLSVNSVAGQPSAPSTAHATTAKTHMHKCAHIIAVSAAVRDNLVRAGYEVLEAGSDFAAIEARLGLPLFVKPANEGSSIGISKVKQTGGLPAAYELAARHVDMIASNLSITPARAPPMASA